MPIAPPKPCKYHGCSEITRDSSGYCAKHKKEHAVVTKWYRRNDTTDPFYGSTRWKKLRVWYKRQHPVCEDCGKLPAQMVHHIIPIKEGGDPMAVDNLQALCKNCHSWSHRKKAMKSRG